MGLCTKQMTISSLPLAFHSTGFLRIPIMKLAKIRVLLLLSPHKHTCRKQLLMTLITHYISNYIFTPIDKSAIIPIIAHFF